MERLHDFVELEPKIGWSDHWEKIMNVDNAWCNEMACKEGAVVRERIPAAAAPRRLSWPQLYEAAMSNADRAGELVVPKPMQVGDEGCPGGLCGGATVLIKGHAAFKKWLRSNPATARDAGRIEFFHPSQSVTRAIAAAHEFALTLSEHGVESTIERILD